MSEEQRIILDMLREGKITVDEAQRLLEALRDGQAGQPGRQEPRLGRGEPRSIVGEIVETIRSGLSNFSFSFGDTGRIVLEESHSGQFSTDRPRLELDVRNGSIGIDAWDEEEFRLEIVKKVIAGTREQAEAMVSGMRFADFDGHTLRAGDQESRNLGNRVSVSLRLLLPRARVYSGLAHSKNGSLDIGGIDMDEFDARTMSGSVRFSKTSGQAITVRTINGSLRLDGGLGRVDAKTTNGSITLVNIAEDSNMRLETVNGRIVVQLPMRDDIGIAVRARTTSGSVRLNHPGLETRYEERRMTGGRSVEAGTLNWQNAGHRIELNLRSVNGSIQINPLE